MDRHYISANIIMGNRFGVINLNVLGELRISKNDNGEQKKYFVFVLLEFDLERKKTATLYMISFYLHFQLFCQVVIFLCPCFTVSERFYNRLFQLLVPYIFINHQLQSFMTAVSQWMGPFS